MTEKEFLLVVGRNINYYRKLAGYTQREFAHKMGLAHTTIGLMECGLSGTTTKTLKKIADILGVTPEQLVHIPDNFHHLRKGTETNA